MKRNFKDLIVWQKAVDLVTLVYQFTQRFPADERFGLTSQIRRSAVSIPSNIAEGQGRNTKGEFIQFVGYAKGSLAELETQLLIASRLGFISNIESIETALNEIARLLNGLLNSLKS